MKVTAETIGRAQIETLLREAESSGDRQLARTARRALQDGERTRLVEHCLGLLADAWNARGAE